MEESEGPNRRPSEVDLLVEEIHELIACAHPEAPCC
jgi:hypothetical protein